VQLCNCYDLEDTHYVPLTFNPTGCSNGGTIIRGQTSEQSGFYCWIFDHTSTPVVKQEDWREVISPVCQPIQDCAGEVSESFPCCDGPCEEACNTPEGICCACPTLASSYFVSGDVLFISHYVVFCPSDGLNHQVTASWHLVFSGTLTPKTSTGLLIINNEGECSFQQPTPPCPVGGGGCNSLAILGRGMCVASTTITIDRQMPTSYGLCNITNNNGIKFVCNTPVEWGLRCFMTPSPNSQLRWEFIIGRPLTHSNAPLPCGDMECELELTAPLGNNQQISSNGVILAQSTPSGCPNGTYLIDYTSESGIAMPPFPAPTDIRHVTGAVILS